MIINLLLKQLPYFGMASTCIYVWDLLMVMVVADPLPSALLGTISTTYTSPTPTSFRVYIVSLVLEMLIMALEMALMTVMK